MKVIWIDLSDESRSMKWSQEYFLEDILKVKTTEVLWLDKDFDENMTINFDSFFVVYSSDQRTLETKTLNFIKNINAQGKKFNLIHMSNEQLKHDVSYYNLANKVYRCYLDFSLPRDNKKIITIPIGYQSGYKSDHNAVLYKDKKYNCCFIGQPKNERYQLLKEIKLIENHFIHETRKWECPTSLSQKDCLQIMANSLLVPIPMGNIHYETHRLYEALEAKTIPVVRRYNKYSYYSDLLGSCPLPVIDEWSQLNDLLDYFKQNDCYDKTQSGINEWYNSIKSDLSHTIINSL